MKGSFRLLVVMLGIILLLAGCARKRAEEVVIYTCLDQIYSEPILSEFEKQTGIKVKAAYDTEATKTVGMVNRLIAEKSNPQADVFWNNEICRTIVLKERGVLAPYSSPSAQPIPPHFKDPQGYWTGFAARTRVIIYNTELIKPEDVPSSIFDLTQEKWRGKACIAYPLFGTTATHAASLFSFLGEEKAKAYFSDLKANQVVILDGNRIVKDQVADGELAFGLTDTDDANEGILSGKPVKIVYPDQDSMGTLVIPNTVSLIAGAPHPENGKRLIDYLLSPEVEEKLAHSSSVQMPLHPGVKTPANVPAVDSIRSMEVDFQDVADRLEFTAEYLQQLFIR